MTSSTTPITMSLQLNFDQVLNLVLQLKDEEKLSLSRALVSSSRASKLRDLRNNFQTHEISEEEIIRECETVRKELYDKNRTCSQSQGYLSCIR